MIPLARRFSFAALVLLAITSLPIWLHRVTGATSDPCPSPEQLRHLDAFGKIYFLRNAEHEESIHAFWAEGQLPPFARGRKLQFRVVRGLDPFAFYFDFHPYYSPLPEDHQEIRPLNAGSDVLPVHHRSDPTTGALKLTRYFFAQGVRPVTHPLPGGLSLALDQLVRGTQPVTLFLISATAGPATLAAFEEHANAWLASAWLEYRSVCRS